MSETSTGTTTLFSCPICQLSLVRAQNRLVCEAAHSFDISRTGYVNLLPSHHRRSKTAGDGADMVRARRSFLESGHYDRLADLIVQILSGATGRHADLGCGEGYFSYKISRIAGEVYGIDISKAAISAAARKFDQLRLAVANVRHIPLLREGFDSASIILAPFPSQAAEIVKVGGQILRVTPGADHLREFKELVYPEMRPHARAEVELPGLRLAAAEELKFSVYLDEAARHNLLTMTPMLYRATRFHDLSGPEVLTTTAHFQVDVFHRHEKGSVA